VLATTGIIAFFGLYDIGLGDDKSQQNKEAALRFAIAGAIVFEYLVMVGIVAFFKEGPDELPLITQAVISNFTAIVGVVIAFYFGASAYIEATKRRGLEKPKDE